MLGRILAVESVDQTALEKDRIAHLDRDLTVAKASLEKKGLQGEAFDKAWKAKEEQIRRDANLRRPFLERERPQPLVYAFGRWSSRKCACRTRLTPSTR